MDLIDYCDLNTACLKDEFPLAITDVMIDNTCGFERMSFMDGFSGYNQIKMYPEEEKHTSTIGGILLYRDALRIKERRSNLSAGNENNFSRSSLKDGRMLCRRHCCQKPQ